MAGFVTVAFSHKTSNNCIADSFQLNSDVHVKIKSFS